MDKKRKRRKDGLSNRSLRRRKAEEPSSQPPDTSSANQCPDDLLSGDESDSYLDCVANLFAEENLPPNVSVDECEASGSIDNRPPQIEDSAVSVDLPHSSDEVDFLDAVDCGTLFSECDVCIDCKCIVCDECKHFDEGGCVHCDWCKSYAFNDEVDDGFFEEVLSPEEARNKEIKDEFVGIVHKHLVKQSLIDDLLLFFRKWSFGSFPKSSKTLLKTPVATPVRPVPPGEYWHRGITSDLVDFVRKTKCTNVKIALGIDGVPLSQSSNSAFWPVLCCFNNSSDIVLAGAYHGHSKPEDSNVFLKEFHEEVKALCRDGLMVDGKCITISLNCLHCDAPAKAFVLKFKNYNGYFSCPKCTQEGEMSGRRMFFAEVDAPLRTDESFRSHTQARHHVGTADIQDILNPVSDVPFDYMHVVLLGVIRKVMYMWLQGPFAVRLRASAATAMSDNIVSLVPWKPREFVRRLRHLQYIKRFKATEFRQILFYTGPIVFESVLRRDVYEHFLVLHVAMTILAHPEYSRTHVDYAEELLKFWVLSFKALYGAAYMSHNVHAVVHLASDVRRFGTVDEFSAFKYENFMQFILKLMRKGEKPLQQLARRYGELANFVKEDKSSNVDTFAARHMDGPLPAGCANPQYSKFRMPGNIQIETSDANNCCVLNDGSVVIVKNFAFSKISKQMVVVGRKFMTAKDLYSCPMPSSQLGIYYLSTLSSLQTWPVESVSNKMYRMPFKEGFAAFPLLHAERKD